MIKRIQNNGTLRGALIKASVAIVVAVLGYFWASIERHNRFVATTEVHIQQQTEDIREMKLQLREIEQLLLRRQNRERTGR